MTNQKNLEFINEFERLMDLFAKAFHRDCDCEMNLSITFPQFMVLQFLLEHEKCKMSDLSRALDVTLGNMTTMVDRLVKQKLILRSPDPGDRRVVRVGLTSEGSRITRKIIESKRRKLRNIIEKIGPTDRGQLLKIMKNIEKYIVKEGGIKR